jgi:hypothetical protein
LRQFGDEIDQLIDNRSPASSAAAIGLHPRRRRWPGPWKGASRALSGGDASGRGFDGCKLRQDRLQGRQPRRDQVATDRASKGRHPGKPAARRKTAPRGSTAAAGLAPNPSLPAPIAFG